MYLFDELYSNHKLTIFACGVHVIKGKMIVLFIDE